MAENAGSVGSISLDLIIKNKIGEQLNKIKSAAEAPAAKVGEAIENAISAPMEKAGEAVGKAVSEAVNSANKAVSDNVTDAIERTVQHMKEQEKALLDAANEAPRAVTMGNNFQYDSSQIEAEIQQMTEKLDKATQETVDKVNAKLSEIGKFDVAEAPTDRLRQEIELVVEQLDLLQKKWQELAAADPADDVTSQLNATEQRIISVQNKLDKLTNSLNKLENASAPEIIPPEITKKVEEAATKTESAFSRIKSKASKVFGTVGSIASGAFKKLKSVGGKALDSLRSRFGGVAKSAVSVTKPISKLGTMLKNSFKRVFFAASIYAAFRAIKDGFLEAAKADKQFSDSLNQVKANLAIAFTPIMQAIMPALNNLMSGLAVITKQIAGFISGLFGSTYKQAAEATKKLKSTADAAKKAKMAMAGIDEMNVLSGGDDEASSGGIDYSKLDMSEPELPDWAEKLKQSIKSGDWKGVGSILAERLNAAISGINWDNISTKVNSGIGKVTDTINGFADKLDWDVLGDTVAGGLNTVTSAINKFFDGINWGKIGSGIAKGLNRAINKTDWKQLGKALSAKIRALIDTAFAFVTTFDFRGLGSGIGDAINGWFEGIDFAKAGRTVSEGIKGVLDAAISVATTVDWRSIGAKIADFICNIDIVGISGRLANAVSKILNGIIDLVIGFVETVNWSKLGSDLLGGLFAMIANIDWSGLIKRAFELAGAAIGAALSLVIGLLKKVWDVLVLGYNSVIGYFNKKIEECGGNIVAGFFLGIIDAIKNVGKWIYDHIFKPFINGFKKAFGIASPSKVMAEMGGYIVDGLYNAVAAGISRISEIFTKMLHAIKDVFSGIGHWFGDIFSAAWENIKSAFSLSSVESFFSSVWSGITRCFGNVTNWFRDKFSEAWQAIKNVFTSGGVIFEGIADNIADIFKETVNSLIDGINWVISKPFEGINWALDGLRDVSILGAEPFSWLPTVDIPEIPHLATGGLATAPTLAMVGDNRNAAVDPEVISPLSKLKGMVGSDPEVVELLRMIYELLKNGMNIEIINYLFRNSKEFSREVLSIVNSDKARGGK